MEWVRNHSILKTELKKISEYGTRGNEKSVKLVGVEITLQAKIKSKKSRTVQPGVQGVPSTNILVTLNGSTFKVTNQL